MKNEIIKTIGRLLGAASPAGGNSRKANVCGAIKVEMITAKKLWDANGSVERPQASQFGLLKQSEIWSASGKIFTKQITEKY